MYKNTKYLVPLPTPVVGKHFFTCPLDGPSKTSTSSPAVRFLHPSLPSFLALEPVVAVRFSHPSLPSFLALEPVVAVRFSHPSLSSTACRSDSVPSIDPPTIRPRDDAGGRRPRFSSTAAAPRHAVSMSADFWAGYVSGALGIVVGNPLDIIKVRRQASSPSPLPRHARGLAARLTTGIAAPTLGYGALNALLFVSYNRSEAALNRLLSTRRSLLATWLAGALGGLSIWVVSTPTELVKCRAQTASPALSSWAVARQIGRSHGLGGFYLGGLVTALRDSIGYGFYFWSYELATRSWPASPASSRPSSSLAHDAPKVLLCGGLAGIATWVSIFPLDVVKTRVQAQGERGERSGALTIAREAYRRHGPEVFFRGLVACSVRAFVVNAVQWAVYEWIMREMGHGQTTVAAFDTAPAPAPAAVPVPVEWK
ncbi:hypothetical protein DCS_03146 [Drechmeria coniospora]|uniref:Mitochondrial carrier protein n=1 Tax=Drechmeria coniospora TaxID=98403 RepID=A0A151GY39_DRECN|nr:hypothetical protein DCS_03146 [Drechmeria coniospora]KYK62001.1 hypothetical protein DCS_03146 [Drechmeria coniospora]